jgi:tetratricopeptide (TPR) repeat protein
LPREETVSPLNSFTDQNYWTALQWVELAERLLSAGNSTQAHHCFLRAIECDLTGEARNAFGRFLWNTGRVSAAAAQYSQVLFDGDRSLEATVRAASAEAARCLAAIFRERHEPANAAQFDHYARQLSAPQAADAFHTGDCPIGNAAVDAILTGDYKTAESLLWHSLLREMAYGSGINEAADWGNLGVLAGLRGELDEAVSHLRHALRLHRILEDDGGVGRDLLHLGALLAKRRRGRLAELTLRLACKRLNQAGELQLALMAANALSQLRSPSDPSVRRSTDPSPN